MQELEEEAFHEVQTLGNALMFLSKMRKRQDEDQAEDKVEDKVEDQDED